MIFNYVDPYQQNVFNNNLFLDPSLPFNPISSPLGLYQPSQGSIDYLVNTPYQGLEQTERHLTAIEISDPLDRFLNTKKESLSRTAKGILEQIYERLIIRDSNFYEIDQRIRRANGILDTLSVFYLGANMVVDKRKAIIQKELISFEQERRFEAVSCWRDISRLKLHLAEIDQQLDNHTSREQLLNG